MVFLHLSLWHVRITNWETGWLGQTFLEVVRVMVRSLLDQTLQILLVRCRIAVHEAAGLVILVVADVLETPKARSWLGVDVHVLQARTWQHVLLLLVPVDLLVKHAKFLLVLLQCHVNAMDEYLCVCLLLC